MEKQFLALVVREQADGSFTRSIDQRTIDDLPEGDVLVRVLYSSLNYKDALSASGNKGVTKTYPHTRESTRPGLWRRAGQRISSPALKCW